MMWIKVSVVLSYVPGLIEADFRRYYKEGMDKPLNLSGVAVFVDTKTKKIDSAYIIDRAKPSTVHVEPRLFKKFVDYYVDFFVINHRQFVIKMLENRGDRLLGGEGSYTLAEAAFGISGTARVAAVELASKIASISGLLPVPKRTEAALELDTKDDGPMRRRSSSGASGLLEGLSPMIDDEGITREAQGIIEKTSK